jgi:uncharacterized protein (TIGR02453 family)
LVKQAYFNRDLFDFLRDLARNNNREWFQANKQRFESDVREPLQRFIADFAPTLHKISPNYMADPKPVGGSLLRINRDTRFSADKSPYKTMAGALFRHARGKDIPSPGFLLHLEPGECFAGIGIHSPDSQTLAKIRGRIASDPKAWQLAVSGKAFRSVCTLMPDSLQRPPRGYSAEHPCIKDLKRKHYCSTTSFTEEEVCAENFLDRFAKTCAAAGDFMKFLTTTVGLPW